MSNLSYLLGLPRQELLLAAQSFGLQNPKQFNPAEVAEMLLPYADAVAALVTELRAQGDLAAAEYRQCHDDTAFNLAVATAFPGHPQLADWLKGVPVPDLDEYGGLVISAAVGLCGSPYCGVDDLYTAHYAASVRGPAAVAALLAYLDLFAEG